MKKAILFMLVTITFLYTNLNSQTLVGAYPFPNYTIYNSFWGVTQINDTLLRVGSDSDGKIYKVTKAGVILDSLTAPVDFNHGLGWDGTGLWIARDASGLTYRFYKINLAGVKVDSILLPSVWGSSTVGIGGIAIQGNDMWFAVYYPDAASYPFAQAYKMNLTSKLITDSIPLRGRQVQGLAVKGDTLFYVTDNFQGDAERIYAYRKAVGDTLFSFAAPDPDGDCDPRGLYWDGQSLFLIANRVGGTASQFRTLYKYSLAGSGSPQITTSTSSILFGDVTIGTTGNQPLTINNVGTGKLIITAKTIVNNVFGITPNNVPDTINPGGSKLYSMSFTPAAYDSAIGQLQISSNDITNPVKTVSLKGKGVFSGAYLSLSATNFNYGNRRINSLCGYIFTVTNQGTNPLSINSMSLTSPRYRVDTVGITLPVVIQPQTSKNFRVWFNPTSVLTYVDSITIQSNAGNMPVARIKFTGSVSNQNYVLGDSLWSGLAPDNPYTSYDDPQPISIKQITDVNGDGVNDVVVASGNYLTTCYNGNASVTADILWIFNTGYDNNNTGSVTWEDAMQIRDDVDGDGIADVVIGCAGGNEMVYTISGRTGRQIWAWGDSISYSDGDIEAVRADRDYNSDGVKDVLISASGTGSGTGGRHSVVCVNGLNGQVIFSVPQPSEFTGDIVATPFGGALGIGNNGGSYAVAGFDNMGNNVWNYTGANGKLWSIKEIPTINADTVKELVGFYGFSSGVFCIAENTGSVLWTKGLGSGNNGKVQLLDDYNGDGCIDLSFTGAQTLYRLDSKSGNTIWSVSPGASYLRGIDYLSDVNGDSVRDIAIATQQPGKIMVINGANGSTLFEFVFGSSINQRGDRVSALKSIDGNPTTEIVGGCRDGRIYCFAGGPNNPIGINPIGNIVPDKFSLGQNYPNPFNPSTTIKFDIPLSSNVKLTVYDAIGREVTQLVNDKMQKGSYIVKFDGINLASGVYLYRLVAGDYSVTKKMTLIK